MKREETHYRKVFNSPYLSSADIVEPTVLTIARVVQEKDQTKKSKDDFNVAYFVEKELRKDEPLKPMILNATNSKTVKSFAPKSKEHPLGSPYTADWNNIPVTICVDTNVKFGRDTVEGLRISTEPPRATRGVLVPKDTVKWNNAKIAFKRDGNLEAVLKRVDISEENEIRLKEEVEAEKNEAAQ